MTRSEDLDLYLWTSDYGVWSTKQLVLLALWRSLSTVLVTLRYCECANTAKKIDLVLLKVALNLIMHSTHDNNKYHYLKVSTLKDRVLHYCKR